MSSTVKNWEIHPKMGIGNMRFGITKPNIDTFADIYGVVVRSGSDRIPDSILEDTLKQFGGALSEEEKTSLMTLYTESGPDQTSVTEVRGDHGLILRYERDVLIEVMLSTSHKSTNLLEKPVFGLSAIDALVLFEIANRGPGRYRSTEAAFDNLAISLDAFSTTDGAERERTVRPMGGKDERFSNRTITLRPKPYAPKNELDQFVTHSFL
ncbi:hypothetical protein AB4Y96_17115 [Phyllobacterium sp. TAF24]|uniref:hypothetical protein n=1 Tax=Phyllobacterium sp. TAF24 TaxID=3233068 RepID=UPI003F9E4616